jgi:negative regulator of flagellin synthesis FlgM
MKIGNKSDTPPAVTPAAQSAPSKTGQSAVATATGGASSAGVAVTVSTLARTLEQSKSGAADIDTKKVEAVRLAIEQGTYTVNPEAIADKLLANAQEMLNRTHS